MTHVLYTSARHTSPRWRFPLWFPFLLVWLLFLPFVLLLAPLVFLACLFLRVNPFRGVAVYWEIFCGLRGLRVVVDDPRAPISLRIF
jgi:hypothetical protein